MALTSELYHYGVKGMRWGTITQDPYEPNPREKKIDIVQRQVQARAKVSNSSSSGQAFVKSNSKVMNTPVSQLQKGNTKTANKRGSVDLERNKNQSNSSQQPGIDQQRAQYEAERERAQYEAEQEAMIEMMIKTRQAAGMPMTEEEIQRMRAEGVMMKVDRGNYGTTTYGNRRHG